MTVCWGRGEGQRDIEPTFPPPSKFQGPGGYFILVPHFGWPSAEQWAYWVVLKTKQKSLNKAASLKRIHEPQIPLLERRFYRTETDRHDDHIIIKQPHSEDRLSFWGGRRLTKEPPGIGSRKAPSLSRLRWAQGCGSQRGPPGSPAHIDRGSLRSGAEGPPPEGTMVS